MLRSAIAATAGVVSFWRSTGDFLFAVTVAIAFGLVVGVVDRVRAIQAAGLGARHGGLVRGALHGLLADRVPRCQRRARGRGRGRPVLGALEREAVQRTVPDHRAGSNWRTLQFVLENGVFLLMGLQISYLVDQVGRGPPQPGAGAALRPAHGRGRPGRAVRVRRVRCCSAQRAHARDGSSSGSPRYPASDCAQMRGSPGVAQGARETCSATRTNRSNGARTTSKRCRRMRWAGAVASSSAGRACAGWSRSRLRSRSPSRRPYRAELVLIAFTVAVVTLLVQGGTLPWLIKLTKIRGADRTEDRRELAELLDLMGACGAGRAREQLAASCPAVRTSTPRSSSGCGTTRFCCSPRPPGSEPPTARVTTD